MIAVTAHNFKTMSEYKPVKRRLQISIGDSVRLMRVLQELSQNELASISGIPQFTLSAIDNDGINLGLERAKVLARALRCHPAVIVFPGRDVERESAA